MEEVRPRRPGAALTHARIRARATRRQSLPRSRARESTSYQSADRQLAECRLPGGRTRLYRSRRARVAHAAPCAAHFHTDCRVLTWMTGQAQQSGSVARYRQFEPARFESARPFSRFIMKHFQDAQVTSFRKTSA